MNGHRVEISFKVFLGDDEWVDEATIRAEPAERTAALRTRLRAKEDLDGALVIRSPNQPDVVIEDALVPLTLNVCFHAVIELVVDRHVVIPYFDRSGYVRLDPEGWYVLLSGDDVPTVRLHRNALQQWLVACGERVIDLLRELGGTEGWLSQLEPRAEDARRALESAPRVWPGVDPASLER
jgi:hypothetical protein